MSDYYQHWQYEKAKREQAEARLAELQKLIAKGKTQEIRYAEGLREIAAGGYTDTLQAVKVARAVLE